MTISLLAKLVIYCCFRYKEKNRGGLDEERERFRN